MVFINIYMHKSSQKISKTQRGSLTWGLTYSFNKGKEVCATTKTNYGEMTKNCMREIKKDKGYFSKVCLCKLVSSVESNLWH